jgi:hypothetical protein
VKRRRDKYSTCEHAEGRFAGAAVERGATNERCPAGDCKPVSVWVKADRLHPLITRARRCAPGASSEAGHPLSAASAGSSLGRAVGQFGLDLEVFELVCQRGRKARR